MSHEKQILEWLAANPGLVTVFTAAIGWPFLSAVGNLWQDWLAQKSPRLAAALKASGFDPLGFARAALGKAPKP